VQLGDEQRPRANAPWLRRVIVGWPLALLVGYLAMFRALRSADVVALGGIRAPTPLQFYVGWPFLREGGASCRRLTANMDTLNRDRQR